MKISLLSIVLICAIISVYPAYSQSEPDNSSGNRSVDSSSVFNDETTVQSEEKSVTTPYKPRESSVNITPQRYEDPNELDVKDLRHLFDQDTQKNADVNNVYVPGGWQGNEEGLNMATLENVDDLRAENRSRKLKEAGQSVVNFLIQAGWVLAIVGGVVVLMSVWLKAGNGRTRR